MTVITVSREYGSGGRDIARAVAEILGAKYVDREIIIEAARRTGVPEDIVSDRDERIQGVVEKLAQAARLAFTGMGTPHETVLAGESPVLTDAQMIQITRSLIRDFAKEGNCVIVGRGANVLLAKHPGALHVHVAAPPQDRVRRVVARRQVSQAAAQRLVAKIDADRAAYVRTFYQADWADAYRYHLVINTGLLNLVQAAQIVVAAAGTLDQARRAAAGQQHAAAADLLTSLRAMREAVKMVLERHRRHYD